ncbi:MAG: neutral/alkaline non-lysosomal ceramidase N-terminal domain-containing protein [Bacteriovoracia bacterium]
MNYEIGLGKQDITCFIPGIGMMGYGQHHNVVREIATPLWARTIIIKEKSKVFILVHLELAFVTIAIKEEVLKRLRSSFPAWNVNEDNVAITAQHTHSAPGGFSHYPFYNFTIPGFQLKVFEKIVNGILSSIEEASKRMQLCEALWGEREIDPSKEIAFNRSMPAHALNPEATHHKEQDKHLAVDRVIQGLSFYNAEGKRVAFLNWFGVHCTSVSSFNQRIHHDNKGIAAALFEQNHPETMAFFLQSSAGDVSPNFIWDKKKKLMRGKFTDQYESASYNGELQFRESEKITGQNKTNGKLEFLHTYLDMSLEVATPAHGVSFFKGTLEGPGVSPSLAKFLGSVSRIIKRKHLMSNPEEHQKFYEAHGNKEIILDHRNGSFLGIPLKAWYYFPPIPEPAVEAMRKTVKSGALKTLPWVPPILPFQCLRLGELLIAFVPGEITVMAGRRLKNYLLSELKELGINQVFINSYANAYMGYITTPEEYDMQCYEGGHTVYGRNTFYGIMKGFALLVDKIKGRPLPEELPLCPFHFPPDELARRSF